MFMLPANDDRGDATFLRILLAATALLPISIIPLLTHQAGFICLSGAIVLGMAFISVAARSWRIRTKAQAKILLHMSVIYLPLLYLFMVFSRIGDFLWKILSGFIRV
jgi:heme O synthase-like polyprenyltransferase